MIQMYMNWWHPNLGVYEDTFNVTTPIQMSGTPVKTLWNAKNTGKYFYTNGTGGIICKKAGTYEAFVSLITHCTNTNNEYAISTWFNNVRYGGAHPDMEANIDSIHDFSRVLTAELGDEYSFGFADTGSGLIDVVSGIMTFREINTK